MACATLSAVHSSLQRNPFTVSATVLAQPDPTSLVSAPSLSTDENDRFMQAQIVELENLAQTGIPSQQLQSGKLASLTITQVGLTDILQITATADNVTAAVSSSNLLLDAYIAARDQLIAAQTKAATDEVKRQLAAVTLGLQTPNSKQTAATAQASNSALSAEYARLVSLTNQIQLNAVNAHPTTVLQRASNASASTSSTLARDALLAGLLGALARDGRPALPTQGGGRFFARGRHSLVFAMTRVAEKVTPPVLVPPQSPAPIPAIQRRGVWWLSPAGALCLVALPTLLLAARTPDSRYRFAWRTQKALTGPTVVLVLCGALVFILAGSLPLLNRPRKALTTWPSFNPAQNRVLVRATGPLFWLTMAGYLAFAVSGARNGLRPAAVLKALLGQNVSGGNIKETLARVSGVTSLTQVGMAFVVVAMLCLVQQRDVRLRRRVAYVLILALLRAALVAERLAILELAIPVVAILAFHLSGPGRLRGRTSTLLAPLVFIPMALVVFGLFEYSRSWVFYSTRTSIGYPQFVLERFAGYYATAYNNGQLELNFGTYPGRVPYDSISALWTAPFVSKFISYPGQGFKYTSYDFNRILDVHGNPEFNSPGGLVVPFVDWGTMGGLMYLAIAGALIGYLYRRCVDGDAFAMVLYPSMTIGLFELPRYVYWALGRYVPTLVALCIVGYLVHKRGDREPEAELGAAPAGVRHDRV